MANNVFSFNNVSVLVDGDSISGFAEGDDPVMFTYNKPATNMTVGVDAFAAFSEVVDRSGTITLKVMPGSPAQAVLENKLATGGIFPISVTDTGTGEGGMSVECLINEPGDTVFGENSTAREWTIHANNWQRNAITN